MRRVQSLLEVQLARLLRQLRDGSSLRCAVLDAPSLLRPLRVKLVGLISLYFPVSQAGKKWKRRGWFPLVSRFPLRLVGLVTEQFCFEALAEGLEVAESILRSAALPAPKAPPSKRPSTAPWQLKFFGQRRSPTEEGQKELSWDSQLEIRRQSETTPKLPGQPEKSACKRERGLRSTFPAQGTTINDPTLRVIPMMVRMSQQKRDKRDVYGRVILIPPSRGTCCPLLLKLKVRSSRFRALTVRSEGAACMAVVAWTASEGASNGIQQLISALKTVREPTVLYEIRCPKSMKMRLAGFHMWGRDLDVSKFNDKTALSGTMLRLSGSGYVLFYSDEYNNGIVLAFSNPDCGTNKIGGKIVVNRMPTSADGDAARRKMDNAYAGEKVVDEVMGVRLLVKNCRGDPATGYYKIECA
eukprot:Skav228553  [mRNA]  locus=scaffold1887:612519:614543:- [translate_table: standard]